MTLICIGPPARRAHVGLRLAAALGASLAAFAFAPAALAAPIVIEGSVDASLPDHVLVPFDVPAGTAEVEVRHLNLTKDQGNVLDFGLLDPNGFRGWGGGGPEPQIVGAQAASRGFVAGPVPAGRWQVVIGKALIKAAPATYRLEIDLRTAPTLAPQPQRRPYVEPAPLATGARFWAGDFHVHSRESDDGKVTMDEVLDVAATRGLDFVELSEHNTISQLDFYNDVQPRHPNVLLLPGVEYTTYDGHGNGIGATQWVDHKIGLNGLTIGAAATAFRDQGAVFALNHPTLDLGDGCIGCAWKQDLDLSLVGAYEVGTGGIDQYGAFFSPSAIAKWTELSALAHITAIGGSDDHNGGKIVDLTHSPMGSPTTLVWAEELSVRAIVEGVRRGRTVVKLGGPQDPMIELASAVAPAGDTVTASQTTLAATVTGGVGKELRLVKAGQPVATATIDADPFRFELPVAAPATGEDFYRAEVHAGGLPRTITSHLYLRAPGGGGTGGSPGCDAPPPASVAEGSFDPRALAALVVFAAVIARRRA